MSEATAACEASAPLLDVRGLSVEFSTDRHRQPLRAVDGVDLTVARGETVGLVGESGSGKSTIGRTILGLTAPSSGRIVFDGSDITRANYRERRRISTHLQVVFQDPYSSLNPTRTVRQTLGEMLRNHRLSGAEVDERVNTMLERVGLGADAAGCYPAQFSGGQRQRIAIARALMVQPRLVICDEPVSALDLSVQAQILNLFRELQRDLGLSYLFIAHDLSVVRYLSHRIVVLYRGRVMEQGDASTVYDYPSHPYTRTLLDAALVPDAEEQRRRRDARRPLENAAGLTRGAACPFSPRCSHAVDVCRTQRPAVELTSRGSLVACILTKVNRHA